MKTQRLTLRKTLKQIALLEGGTMQWVKGLVLLLSIYFFYVYVWKDVRIGLLVEEAQKLVASPWLLIVSILLMPLNWMLEAQKWRRLVLRFYTELSLGRAVQATLAGTVVSLWMPNRTGEYLGRVLFLPGKHRWAGALCTFIGSGAQLSTTLILGTIGYLWLSGPSIGYEGLYWGLWIVTIAGALALITVFVKMWPLLARYTSGPKMAWIYKRLEVYSLYSEKDLWSTLGWSVLRYAVFSLQMFLLMRAVGVEVPSATLVGLICSMFLIQTIIPGNVFSDLLVRGATIPLLFTHYSNDIEAPILAAACLWCINIIVPSLIGLVFWVPAVQRRGIKRMAGKETNTSSGSIES